MYVTRDIDHSEREGVIELLFYLWKKKKELSYIDYLIENNLIQGCYNETSVLVGILIYRKISDEIEIFDIVTDPEHRRKGVATTLLKALISKLKPVSVFLELRASNSSAYSLYEKNGFKIIGKRHNYYENPTEDAILLKYHQSE